MAYVDEELDEQPKDATIHHLKGKPCRSTDRYPQPARYPGEPLYPGGTRYLIRDAGAASCGTIENADGMEEHMNSTEFAHIWLETHGLFDKDSDYDGWLGKSVEEVWHFIAKQGHSGGSAARTFQLLQMIYEAYDNPDDPIWKAYWESNEGSKFKESFEAHGLPKGIPVEAEQDVPDDSVIPPPTANPKPGRRGMLAM